MKVQGAGALPTAVSVGDSKVSRAYKGSADKVGGEKVASSHEGAEVRVSREAVALSMSRGSSVDSSRVERLRDTLSGGSAKVDSVAIAKKIAEDN